MYLILLSCLFSVSDSVVPFKRRSDLGNYQLKVKSIEAAYTLLDRLPDLKDQCTSPTRSLTVFCEGITKKQSMNLLQQDDLLIYIDEMKNTIVNTIKKHTKGRFEKRSVPWNLDRLNQQGGVLDNSYQDDADVDVYILGSGIRADHSEFENRASVGFSAFSDQSDCEGSGTELASLVGGRNMGLARKATLIGVKVIDCDGTTNKANVIRGISYIEGEILKTANRRAVVLVGFTMDRDSDINSKLVSLTEIQYGSHAGVLVVAGAGESDDLDACTTTPASAQGGTALNGVVTIGATDESDTTVSNIGECVDLFAPGADIPAAGVSSPTDITSCSGSLCAAALATGVIANSLRENSKIDIEVQKSMLVNGATVVPLTLPPDNTDYKRTRLISQTPHKLLYSSCGYYKNEAPPVCESYTATCNNSKVTTFDGNNVPLYQQKAEKCGFHVFESKENAVSVQGSYHKCSLGAYTVSWQGNNIVLLPGPVVIVNNKQMVRVDIQYEDDDMSIQHEVDFSAEPREPQVVISLKRGGEEEIHITFDSTSRLTITLMKFDRYSGNTGGLCGFYDSDGTNDYRLPDGTQLPSYSTSFHEKWRARDVAECQECSGDGCPCEDDQCEKEATQYCTDKLQGASSACLSSVNVYKERQACISEVSKCCCQAKRDGNSAPDLGKVCCQNSFFGNFERNREGCSFCEKPTCKKEETNEHCVDNTNGREQFEYNESVEYDPENCCYYIPDHDTQVCTAPRNKDMMWDKRVPVCEEKTCEGPVVPNDQTVISPEKRVYSCGETVTVTCNTCHEINPEPQVIQCRAGNGEKENDADWTEEVNACQIITCPEPTLPDIDDNKNIKYPLSWITSPVPHGTECGDSVQFECDVCYDMYPEDGDRATCQEDGRWTDSPRCRLRYCSHPQNPTLDYPLTIRNVQYACNDTIEYYCRTRDDDPVGAACYDLVGEEQSSCRADDDNSIDWNSDRPSCNIRHCDPLKLTDLSGEGYYQYLVSSAADEYQRIWLTDTGSDGPTECGSEVHVVCDNCHYLCGPVNRTCLPDGTWGSERPRCAKRYCRTPDNEPEVSNSLYSPTITPFACGDTVTFRCKEDCYEYSDGTEVHTCQADLPEVWNPYESKAKWDGKAYSCTIKECPALAAPDNGGLSNEDTTCGTVVRFSCDECYRLEGEKELKCQTDKSWSDNVPRCVKKECPEPGYPLHGQGEIESRECGEAVQYSCDTCYYLEGEEGAVCLDTGVWSNPIPQCAQWECDKRRSPTNGWLSNSNHNLCADKVTYGCNVCYEMTAGSDSATCLHGGSWSDPEPTCSIKTCSRPDVPVNTVISPDKASYNCGEYIKVQCDECYELDAIDIHCTDSGWERDVPGCGIKQCDPPGPLTMVNMTRDYGIVEGGELSAVVEEVDGLVVQAAKKETSKARCGESVEYECDVCYNLKGNKKIFCETNQQWTNKPVCELKLCSEPEPLTEHLVVSPDQQIYSCKEPIVYSCDDTCWSLEGSPQRACVPVDDSNSTTWYPEQPPHCSIKRCLPPWPEDPLVSHTTTGNYTCGSTLTYTCPPCFKLDGSPTATCLSDEDWDTSPPVCVPVCCPPLREPRSGDPDYDVATMTYNYTSSRDREQDEMCGVDHVCQRVDVTCQECYEWEGEGAVYSRAPRRECQHPGSWTNEGQVCTRKECETREPDSTEHIRYTDGGMADMTVCGNRVSFECNECYENLDGVLEHTCLPSKQWSHPIPTCSLKECSNLPVVDTHCTFPGEHMTCGSPRQVECDDCYYTDKCQGGNTADISVVCSIHKEWEWKSEKPVVSIKTCDPPLKMEHATFASDGRSYSCGRIVKYACDECFELEDPGDCNCAKVECKGGHESDCTKGSWVGTLPKCLPKTCEALEIPEHAHVIVLNSGCLQTTQFECDKGYEQVGGDLSRTCKPTKQWSGSEPLCRIRNCTQLQAPDNGTVSTEDRHYGTVVAFSCDSCYRFPDSMVDPRTLEKKSVYPRYHILACEEHGNWNGSEPVCQRKYCGKPHIPGNADITDYGFYCGDDIGYTCDTGYYHFGGDNVRYCGEDRQWDGEDFQCKAKNCTTPREIENATFTPELEEYVHMSSVMYDCDYCHQATTELQFTCQDTDNSDQSRFAQWEPSELPKCSRTQCPAVKAGPNSNVRPIDRRLSITDCSQVVVVECDLGYHVRGPTKSIFCQSSGIWTSEVPQCEVRCCPKREYVENGLITALGDGHCYGDRIQITCDTCYEMVLDRTAQKEESGVQTCQANGGWSDELPYCQLTKCPRTPFSNGNYSDSSYWGYCGSTRTFQCYQGYTMKGTNRLTCREDGNWSGTVPICEPNICSADVLNIQNGDYRAKVMGMISPTASPDTTMLPTAEPVRMDNYPLYTRVYLWCNEGYDRVGLQEIYCTEDGTWNDNPPRCTKEVCPEPDEIGQGEVTWNHLKEGARATYECGPCYRLQGYKTLTCSDGEWVPQVTPYCKENVCYPPGEEPNSNILGYNSTKETYSCGEKVEYGCDDGHNLHGNQYRTCSEDGRWSGSAPVCANIACPPVSVPANGGMRQENGSNYLVLWCEEGYQMGAGGSSALLCVKGQWQGVEPTCAKQVCGDPGVPDWGIRVGGSYEYEDAVTYSCREGYQLRGARTITCTHRGLWDYSRPYCVCNECPRLNQPPNGYVMTTDSNSYLALVEYICSPGYEVMGNATRTCLASGQWSGDVPRCERLNCTEHYRVPEGGYVHFTTGHRYEDQLEIRCPNLKGGWVRTCQQNGLWSGDLPERCDCRKEIRKIPVKRQIVKPATCILGKCTPKTVWTVTVYEDREFSVCD